MDGLVLLDESFRDASNKGLITGVIFVDFSEALDKVYHTLLTVKLHASGSRGSLLCWLFFINCSSQIRFGSDHLMPVLV